MKESLSQDNPRQLPAVKDILHAQSIGQITVYPKAATRGRTKERPRPQEDGEAEIHPKRRTPTPSSKVADTQRANSVSTIVETPGTYVNSASLPVPTTAP